MTNQEKKIKADKRGIKGNKIKKYIIQKRIMNPFI